MDGTELVARANNMVCNYYCHQTLKMDHYLSHRHSGVRILSAGRN